MEKVLSATPKYFRKDQQRSPRDFFLSRNLNMTNRTIGTLFFILILTAACGSDNSTGPARAHFTSTLTATKCANAKYSLTANWQATGTWQAVFTSETGATAVSETSPVDANQTKTSSCLFTPGTKVYAILVPVTVLADADNTPTLDLP
jgi:hypothetical protein